MKEMEYTQIKQLLTRYYDGTTTLEEERILQEYFSGEGEIPADLVSSGRPFTLFRAAAGDKPDTRQLESRLNTLIDDQAAVVHPVSRQRTLYRFLVAASVSILIGISGIFIYRSQKSVAYDTFTDPVAAYNEAQRTLLYISDKMNQGMKPLSHITAINTGTDKLKSLEKMNESMGMLNLVSFINKSSNLKK
jgi:hypothetical protein